MRLTRAAALPEPAPVDPSATGIVHLGIGAFHRAHQAVFTQDAMRASGDPRWGILGVTQRSAGVRDQLRPQGGLYSVLTVGEEPRVDVVGAVRDVAWPAEETGRVLATIAAPDTHILSLTVTEKGYGRAADGGLDVEAARGDLDAARAGADAPSTSAVGLVVRGLVARHAAGGAPLTVVSCDNLPGNGAVLAGLVRDGVAAALPGGHAEEVLAWLAQSVRFPSTMVDRIVPATTEAARARVEELIGYRDEGVVMAEAFRQWVIEDAFAGPRPAWEAAGATLAADVEPYERAKLRLLNGAHSLLAYAGARRGYATIAEAVTDPELAALARALQAGARATLSAPDGLDLEAYSEEILDRFANPANGHRTAQVGADGTQKIPVRWGATVADLRALGLPTDGFEAAYQEWAAFVVEQTTAGVALDDPRAGELAAAAAGGGAAARARVLDLL